MHAGLCSTAQASCTQRLHVHGRQQAGHEVLVSAAMCHITACVLVRPLRWPSCLLTCCLGNCSTEACTQVPLVFLPCCCATPTGPAPAGAQPELHCWSSGATCHPWNALQEAPQLLSHTPVCMFRTRSLAPVQRKKLCSCWCGACRTAAWARRGPIVSPPAVTASSPAAWRAWWRTKTGPPPPSGPASTWWTWQVGLLGVLQHLMKACPSQVDLAGGAAVARALVVHLDDMQCGSLTLVDQTGGAALAELFSTTCLPQVWTHQVGQGTMRHKCSC